MEVSAPVGDAGHGHIKEVLAVEHLINNLIHVRQREIAISIPQPHLARYNNAPSNHNSNHCNKS